MSKFFNKVLDATSAIINAPGDIISTIADGLGLSGHTKSRFYSANHTEAQYQENQRQHFSREFHWHLKSERKDEALSMLAKRLDPNSEMFNFHLYDSEQSSSQFNRQPTLALTAKRSMLPVMRELISVHGLSPNSQWWSTDDMGGKSPLIFTHFLDHLPRENPASVGVAG